MVDTEKNPWSIQKNIHGRCSKKYKQNISWQLLDEFYTALGTLCCLTDVYLI